PRRRRRPPPPLFPYTTLFRSDVRAESGRAGDALWGHEVHPDADDDVRQRLTTDRRFREDPSRLGLAQHEVVRPLAPDIGTGDGRSEEHTSELQSRFDLVCRLL